MQWIFCNGLVLWDSSLEAQDDNNGVGVYLDPPMQYLFGSCKKNPNQKTIPNPKRNYIGGTR